MNAMPIANPGPDVGEHNLVDDCSFEATARDTAALAGAADVMRAGSELFLANLPKDGPDVLVEAAVRVRGANLTPVPHIVARNIGSGAVLRDLLARLSGQAGVDRVLVLGGDRDQPAGAFASALDVLQSGAVQAAGIRRVMLACYPERHPRIADDVLSAALAAKLAFCAEAGLEASLVSQFAFDAAPVIGMARRLRASGVTAPLRIGLAGPVSHTKLLAYALRCGVGPSIRILQERRSLALSLLAGETPDALVAELSAAVARDPALAITGIHLFTFGALARSAQWARSKQGN